MLVYELKLMVIFVLELKEMIVILNLMLEIVIFDIMFVMNCSCLWNILLVELKEVFIVKISLVVFVLYKFVRFF